MAWFIDEYLRLRSRDTTVSQEVYLSTSFPNRKSAKWEFLLQMNFDPSAANRAKIYLFSDHPILSGSLRGYFLQIGETGDQDGVDLYRQEGNGAVRLFEGSPMPRASPDTLKYRFRIWRDPLGNWEIGLDPSGGYNFVLYGRFRVPGPVPEIGGFFGIKASYTRTRSGGFLLDDLLITDPGPTPLIPPVRAEWGSVLITELFPDPTPVAGTLPEAEFFELYNPGDTTIQLSGWTWQDRTTMAVFDRDSIAPGEYLIVCDKKDTLAFSRYGRTAGISPFPSLNNAGDRVLLSTPLGKPIDSLMYSNRWYRDPIQREGGFTLERIAFSIPCVTQVNWAPSTALSGGTPGAANSPRDSLLGIRFVGLRILDSLTIEVEFNSVPDSVPAQVAANYRLNNGAGVLQAELHPEFQRVTLHLNGQLRRGALYRLNMEAIQSCFGVALENPESEFLYPQLASRGDVVINEILFNPYPGDPDFVEIYNRSEKILDLADLNLSSGTEADTLPEMFPLADRTALFYPGEYRLLTRFPDKIKARYSTRTPDVFVEVGRFPAYRDESGQCGLWSRGVLIDELVYQENMHFQLLAVREGVSLEKVHFDLPAGQPGAFRSAAATAGYATPGYANSQFLPPDSLFSDVIIPHPLFRPDGNGSDNLLELRYRFPEPNRVANIRVFNSQGGLVRYLAANLLLGTNGKITWDGRSDAGVNLETGPYVVSIEVFSPGGDVFHFKKFCVLARTP